MQKTVNKRGGVPLWVLLVCDFLIGALILCVFAYFHHVKSHELVGNGTVITNPYTTEELPWKEKFADKFTEEIVKTDNTYQSPYMSITVTEHKNEADTATYYVADIYVASIECLSSWFADGVYGSNIVGTGMEMYKASGAVIALNGDYYGARSTGVVIRNGTVYRPEAILNQDTCVMFYDGTVETYLGKNIDIDMLVKKGAYQAWSFGPSLLDENGKALKEYPSWYSKISGENPRSAFGYYEPGHYCFVSIDGRSDESAGMSFAEMSELFEELGCKVAYNMDGGKSSFMVFNEKYVNNLAWGGREISDCIIIKDPYANGDDK